MDQLKVFLEYVSPSLRFKVFYHQYKNYLQQQSVFHNRFKVIKNILEKLDVMYYEAEQKIMEQFDDDFRSFIITGQGLCLAYEYLDNRKKIFLGAIPEGGLIGLTQVLFQSLPYYSIETSSYCTVGIIP